MGSLFFHFLFACLSQFHYFAIQNTGICLFRNATLAEGESAILQIWTVTNEGKGLRCAWHHLEVIQQAHSQEAEPEHHLRDCFISIVSAD